MKMNTVESATLAAIGYDDTRGILQLEFRSRAIYRYFDVPAPVHEGLVAASSKGRYFNGAIRGKYRYLPAVDKRGGAGEEA
jgi:hypothetical protein